MVEILRVSNIYGVRTTVGQEVNVALLIESRAKAQKIPIKAVVVVEGLRGIVFVEAPAPQFVDKVIYGIKHVKGRIRGKVSLNEIERLIVPKPIIEELNVGDTIEIISGPLRGMRAKIIRLDKARQEVTVELLETPYPLPITISADYVKLIEKHKSGEE